MNIQAKVALDKQDHPERYCKEPRCLWKVLEPIQVFNGGSVYQPKLNCPGGRCPRHQTIVPRPTAEADDALGVPKSWREKHHD